MKFTNLLTASFTILTSTSATAALVQWQAQVNTGTVAVSKNFSTITTPVTFDVGSLTGDRSFEFIFNAATGTTPSSALLGTFAVEGGKQALKFEQWNKTGFFGMTSFGVADYITTVSSSSGADIQAVFNFDGTKTDLYVNGTYRTTILGDANANVSLGLTGPQGLGGALNGVAYADALQGSIYGFASYDSALSPAEIATHYSAFATPVPETGACGLIGLALMGGLKRRRRI